MTSLRTSTACRTPDLNGAGASRLRILRLPVVASLLVNGVRAAPRTPVSPEPNGARASRPRISPIFRLAALVFCVGFTAQVAHAQTPVTLPFETDFESDRKRGQTHRITIDTRKGQKKGSNAQGQKKGSNAQDND